MVKREIDTSEQHSLFIALTEITSVFDMCFINLKAAINHKTIVLTCLLKLFPIPDTEKKLGNNTKYTCNARHFQFMGTINII